MRFIYTKAFAIFASCLCLLAFLMFLQSRGWLDPFRTAMLDAPRPVVFLVRNVALPVKTFFTSLYSLKKIAEENGQLHTRVAQLEQQLVQYDQQARENEALKKELGFVKNSQNQMVPCTVVSENSFGLTDSLILNCGTDDGVNLGQAVLSEGYLVGKINYAGKNESTALLATASDFSTDAQISQTGTTGIVKGSYGSGLILDLVPQQDDLQNDWLVVTAGINQEVPKNLLIGKVTQLLSSGSDLFKRAAVASPIDFNNLEFVFVVK